MCKINNKTKCVHIVKDTVPQNKGQENSMADNENGKNIEIIHESITTVSKRLKYDRIKELYTEAQAIRVELHQSQSEDVLDRLEAFIAELSKLQKSSSKYLNTDEVMSDLEWIIEYKKNKEWLHVTRWLSNMDSSLREMWSQYIEKIVDIKKKRSEKYVSNQIKD